ncbi:MAG: hypothetical protein M3O20_17340 [Acidobacteriota bacterium]|nr:hypothetical protein [Pseudomonadota bacterium]MDP9115429.1 hypothetical protein [Acidobacteriota bacterium]
MAKRDIVRAAKAAGIKLVRADWSWQPTPEESVPCWAIEIEDRDGNAEFEYFLNTGEAVDWIKGFAGDGRTEP